LNTIMQRTVLTCLLAALPAVSSAAAPAVKLIAEVKGFASPESVATDGKLYYVSNVGKDLKPTAKDGDGFISRMGLGGEDLELRFIEGLNAPKGMLVHQEMLLVCDVDVLLGFDLATRKKTLEISFAKDGVEFLNDICAATGGRFFVSATDKNTIYLVDPKDGSAKPLTLDKKPNGPNGLEFVEVDGDSYLLVAEWGGGEKPDGLIQAYQLDGSLLKGEWQEPDDDFPVKPGYKDGIALYTVDGQPRGVLHSDWVDFKPGGKVLLLKEEEALIALPLPGAPLGGPADFHFCAKTSVLALPCMLDGRVLLVQLKPARPEPVEAPPPAGEGESS
jgi:hypothetical protein